MRVVCKKADTAKSVNNVGGSLTRVELATHWAWQTPRGLLSSPCQVATITQSLLDGLAVTLLVLCLSLNWQLIVVNRKLIGKRQVMCCPSSSSSWPVLQSPCFFYPHFSDLHVAWNYILQIITDGIKGCFGWEWEGEESERGLKMTHLNRKHSFVSIT